MFTGDLCTISSSGINGMCRLISSCPSAKDALQRQGIIPQNCGFKNNEPIVCCDESYDSGAGNPSIISLQSTTEKMQTTVSFPTEVKIQQVGDKSKQSTYLKKINYEGFLT